MFCTRVLPARGSSQCPRVQTSIPLGSMAARSQLSLPKARVQPHKYLMICMMRCDVGLTSFRAREGEGQEVMIIRHGLSDYNERLR